MTEDPLGLSKYVREGLLKHSSEKMLTDFYHSYLRETRFSCKPEAAESMFQLLIRLIVEQIKAPYQFQIFHQCIRQPFDYYQFGLDFIRPLIDFPASEVIGRHFIDKLLKQLKNGENVIFLANHQTEPDPQIISLLLEEIDPIFPSQMIFVAGHRVISDPVAIPMSMGRNLLCIYSKKHIGHPIEQKAEKISHNQRTMKTMGELLKDGGRCIYVAPSGGRDRQNADKIIEVAPFDPQSLELFSLMAQHSGKPTHFYPLSLRTYELMPPPRHIEREVGEKRIAKFTPVHLAFGEEIDMDVFPGSEGVDKKTKRYIRAEYIWNTVRKNYHLFISN
ncbi:MAG: 1-acyl-sn-glycerol-3-phosphate acyltransferase [Candidatus Protochlamydia sp.]|nr:1-acyl-sn-glycerol-3-phosphate acyltransferase [Candidatus Protochlamydia sp.]